MTITDMKIELIKAVRTLDNPDSTEEQKAAAQKLLTESARSAGATKETRLASYAEVR